MPRSSKTSNAMAVTPPMHRCLVYDLRCQLEPAMGIQTATSDAFLDFTRGILRHNLLDLPQVGRIITHQQRYRGICFSKLQSNSCPVPGDVDGSKCRCTPGCDAFVGARPPWGVKISGKKRWENMDPVGVFWWLSVVGKTCGKIWQWMVFLLFLGKCQFLKGRIIWMI